MAVITHARLDVTRAPPAPLLTIRRPVSRHASRESQQHEQRLEKICVGCLGMVMAAFHDVALQTSVYGDYAVELYNTLSPRPNVNSC